METVFNEIQHSVKNWWTSLLLGIVYIIVALWLMFSPLSSYVALSIVFSISMLISGILEIIFSLSNRKGDRKSTRLNSSHTDSSRMPSSA